MSFFDDDELGIPVNQPMIPQQQSMQPSQAIFSKKPQASADYKKLTDNNIIELMYRHKNVLIYKGSIVIVEGRRLISSERLVLNGDVIVSFGKTGLKTYIYNDERKLQDSDIFPSYIELSRQFLENTKPEQVTAMSTGKVEYLPVYMTFKKPISTKQMLIDIGELNPQQGTTTTTKTTTKPESHYANFNELIE